ncbi:hypothetical protein FOZ60_004912 [Perkinsus olseni]|uniref:Uncharacterized protein n=1 Tax=Perkinsus olseni TaxID=32597 RepID=A0A7J6PJ42_PEROL|nr:hypothetical protein FOZ60_004912 [Perkinsus olseni]
MAFTQSNLMFNSKVLSERALRASVRYRLSNYRLILMDSLVENVWYMVRVVLSYLAGKGLMRSVRDLWNRQDLRKYTAYVSIPNDRQDDIQRARSGPITVPTPPVVAPNAERAPPPVDPAAVSVPSGGTTDLRSASSHRLSQAADASVLLSTPQEESPATPSGPSLSLTSPSVPSIPSVPSLLLTSPDLASRPSSPAPVPDNINSGHVSEATPFTSPNASMVDARSGTSPSSNSSSVATEQDAVSANSDFDSTTPNVSSDAGESLHEEELAVPEEENPVLEQEEAPVRKEEADSPAPVVEPATVSMPLSRPRYATRSHLARFYEQLARFRSRNTTSADIEEVED